MIQLEKMRNCPRLRLKNSRLSKHVQEQFFKNNDLSQSPEKEPTRREPLKSARYLRLKKRKVFEIVKGGPFVIFQHPLCCITSSKIKGRQFGAIKIFSKKSFEENSARKYLS